MKNKMITLIDCQNNRRDAQIAFGWRNDPKTIAASYIALPKTWDSFWLEYNAGYFEDADFPPVFVFESGEPAGFVRFERANMSCFENETVVEVMINIAPRRRGEGIGTETLIALKKRMRDKGVFALTADIKSENKASRKAFEHAGFSLLNERTEYIAKTRENCRILCYLCKL